MPLGHAVHSVTLPPTEYVLAAHGRHTPALRKLPAKHEVAEHGLAEAVKARPANVWAGRSEPVESSTTTGVLHSPSHVDVTSPVPTPFGMMVPLEFGAVMYQ